MKDPELRASELNHTGSPHPYIVDYEVLVDEPRSIEQSVHRTLSHHKEGKEWFRCTVEEAVVAIKSLTGENIISESYKRANKDKAEKLIQEKNEKERIKRAISEERNKINVLIANRRKEINSRYEILLNQAAETESFWSYYIVSAILMTIAVNALFKKMSEFGMFLFVIIGSFIFTPLFKGYLEDKKRNSEQYKSILKKRDADLQKIETDLSSQKKPNQLRSVVHQCSSCKTKNSLKERLIPGIYHCSTCGKLIENPFI